MKPLPYLSRAEMRAILDQCTRHPDGCLIFQPRCSSRPHLFKVRGVDYNVVRLMWSETYGFTADAVGQLANSEVIHIPECPHVGASRCGQVVPLCIEPTHLILGTAETRCTTMKERRA